LLVTTIQEIIATRFGFRAKILQRVIFRMLEDENKFSSRFKSVIYLFKKSGNGGKKNSTSFEFYEHPLIKFLGEGSNHSKPAYINKETDPQQIISILRIVLSGKKYFTQQQSEMLAELIIEPEKNTHVLLHEVLSDREFQIFSMLASGMKKSEIAGKLLISKNTIGNHRSNIIHKMNLETNSELTRYAIQHGIIK